MAEALIAGHGLRLAFDGVEVVRGVDIALHAGEVHAILGENGAGKSSVAKLLAGVYRPTGGEIRLRGEPIRMENPRHAISLGVALIHQEPLTFPDLEVAENVFVGHHPVGRTGVRWGEMRTRAEELFRQLGVRLDPRAKVEGLSVADQQMIELAAALSHRATVFLFDETTASLTPKEVGELFRVMRDLKAKGHALAFVSHRLDEVFEIADRITVLRDGAKVAERLPRGTSIEEIVRLMVGREAHLSAAAQPPSLESEPVLRVRGLTVPGRCHDIAFELRPGEIVALAGLVGAGRTDVLQALFGGVRASGALEVQGRPARIRSPRDAMRLGLALVPEDRQHEGLLMAAPILENVTLAALRSLASAGFPIRRHERREALATVDRLRVMCRSVDQPVRQLSGGNQQKVVVGKWLLTKPRVLLLDEPTRGVDVGAKAEIHALIRALAQDGLAVLMASSDLPEVLSLATRVLVMREGRLVDEMPAADATAERIMVSAAGAVP